MVQRYVEGGYGVSEMEPDAEGNWVDYEDYAALETKYENLLQVVRESIRKIELEVADDN